MKCIPPSNAPSELFQSAGSTNPNPLAKVADWKPPGPISNGVNLPKCITNIFTRGAGFTPQRIGGK